MPERRADELKKGDVLSIRGDRYTVLKAKQHGKQVRLTIDGRRGSFTDDVKGRTLYDVVVASPGGSLSTKRSGSGRAVGAAMTPEPRPLHSPDGSMNRWAEPAEAARTQGWAEMSKTDQRLVDRLGARLVGVEVEGGKLVVPPVDDTTLLGHLATMHGVRYDGATFNEAKAWAKANDPGGTATAEETMSALTLEKARELHANLHLDLTAMPKPHWHRERAPR